MREDLFLEFWRVFKTSHELRGLCPATHPACLPLADSFAAEAAPANRSTPIFMAHGLSDPVVMHARAVESREFLRKQGYRIEWHEYRMPHSVCGEEVADIAAWLRNVLLNAL